MKYLRSPQAWGLVPAFKTRVLPIYLAIATAIAMLASTAQADNALSYQPALRNYQRFEQAKSPSQAHDHARHEASSQDAGRHDQHQQHESSAHEKNHEHIHDHSHDPCHDPSHDHSHAHEQE